MKSILAFNVLVFVLGIGVLGEVSAACKPVSKTDAKHATNSALSTIQLACVFSSFVTDAKKVAEVCNIADDMIPLVRDLVGQREGARRAGVVWPGGPVDAGSDQ